MCFLLCELGVLGIVGHRIAYNCTIEGGIERHHTKFHVRGVFLAVKTRRLGAPRSPGSWGWAVAGTRCSAERVWWDSEELEGRCMHKGVVLGTSGANRIVRDLKSMTTDTDGHDISDDVQLHLIRP
ncbi:hypothetical protein GGX14DRAFT_396023 [Mycena pura]|uniref:Uncharacterized protein n=1 Tax=Mycena pura TaxID=153505 RepID=A0AAD6URK6_9AGAR|nr:hypothetical protein GGX14DRAFT_409193 [Mycena pura]KAJ7206807.1 hypothetical protein GGX14DRAFT_396737 [Mycena pura]KAJ7208385.1 hypothetical protein GGX14DRAFT_396023 [Mycena pura]